MDYNLHWDQILKAFPIINTTNNVVQLCSTLAADEYQATIQLINELNLTEVIQSLVIDSIETISREIIAPKFWVYFKPTENDYEGFKQFHSAVDTLFTNYTQLETIAGSLDNLRQQANFTKPIYQETNTETAIKLIIRASLLAQIPVDHKDIIQNFYQVALNLEMKNSDCDNFCNTCNEIYMNCLCFERFNETNRKLLTLELLDPLVGQIITSTIYEYIENHVEKTCKDQFDTYCIEKLEDWLDSVVIQWLKKIYCSVGSASKFSKKLLNFLTETYTKLRINQLFNIIIEYPESTPALCDLRNTLSRTDLRPSLLSTLQAAMETRLLHPGVSTPDILTAYVAAIRSMRVLDPTGLLLDTITQPVHQYLRSRDDTVRCVVSSLTEESPNDLCEELVKGEGIQMDENTVIEDDSDAWISWMPDPVDADPQKTLSTRRTNDIISMLVNVYGSKELFVNEYRTLLADRLLTQLTCDTEKEIRYLELLKLRFGDAQLHYCEVMLKDIADSRRIAHHIRHNDTTYRETRTDSAATVTTTTTTVTTDTDTDNNPVIVTMTDTEDADSNITIIEPIAHNGVVITKTTTTTDGVGGGNAVVVPMHAMILSAQFWPAFKEDRLQLHESVDRQFEEYTRAFESLKGNRTLCWKKHLGLVELEIDLTNGRKLELAVTPVHATIIMHFQDKKIWPLDELSRTMNVPATILKRKIGFWQSHGLIVEEKPDLFALMEEHEDKSSHPADILVEEESESAMASTQDQREEELQTFWSYVIGMLMNLDSLPLERIHQMLKMFAFQGPTIECSLQELRQFLDRKVREHQLVYAGGLYKLPKPFPS